MRNRYDENHILHLCEEVDYDGILPTMRAQVAVNELCRYFLGDDWYDASGAISPEQVNTNIVVTIEKQYKGKKLKRHIVYK